MPKPTRDDLFDSETSGDESAVENTRLTKKNKKSTKTSKKRKDSKKKTKKSASLAGALYDFVESDDDSEYIEFLKYRAKQREEGSQTSKKSKKSKSKKSSSAGAEHALLSILEAVLPEDDEDSDWEPSIPSPMKKSRGKKKSKTQQIEEDDTEEDSLSEDSDTEEEQDDECATEDESAHNDDSEDDEGDDSEDGEGDDSEDDEDGDDTEEETDDEEEEELPKKRKRTKPAVSAGSKRGCSGDSSSLTKKQKQEMREQKKQSKKKKEEKQKKRHSYGTRSTKSDKTLSSSKNEKDDDEKSDGGVITIDLMSLLTGGKKSAMAAAAADGEITKLDKKYLEVLEKEEMYDMEEAEFEYFKKLDTRKKKKIIRDLRALFQSRRDDKPLRFKLLELDLPPVVKQIVFQKLQTLSMMEPASGEYFKLKQWIEAFQRLPLGKYIPNPVSFPKQMKECQEFLIDTHEKLNESVYGHQAAKVRLLQYIGQTLSNPSSNGNILSIFGPPGIGKTSLMKEGVAEAFKRPFHFISLGGNQDASFLEGHSVTYEGSIYGRIAEILMESKCMNPIIYFDELDKVSDTPKGQEIIGLLTHITDSTQNQNFHDKYFSGIPLDLSRVLFVFSFNDIKSINSILKDRMYTIQLEGFNKEDKLKIATDYMLPKIIRMFGWKKEEVTFQKEAIEYMIETFTKEKGVRGMKQCLETIMARLNLFRIMDQSDKTLDMPFELEDFQVPYTVTRDTITSLLDKKKDQDDMPDYMKYMFI